MEAQDLTYDMCRRFVNDLADTHPYKDRLLGMIRARNLERLCSCRDLIVDMQSIDINVFRSLLQVEAFFKKNEAFSDHERCLDAAKLSFLKAEAKCRRTNKRLTHFYLNPNRLDLDVKLVIERARSWIRSTLGDLNTFTDRIPELVRVTAGATADQSRRKSLPFLKVKRNIEVNGRGSPYIEALFAYFKLGAPRVKINFSNRVEFVPKNWKTYRTIACEPTGNIPLQLAFDSYVKSRLARKGIDLRSQSENQELARQGSIDGSFATIDLAAASDTVSLNTCAWLFPREWFEYMLAFRSSLYRHPITGRTTSYEKFSSMGNGMTFCIETLVFAALARACGSKGSRVYGDDICIETEYVPSYLRMLKLFGFDVNLEKSFSEGPYRESCGTHWFNGYLVTPFFVRGNLKLKPFQAHVVNGLASISVPDGELWKLLRDFTVSQALLVVPLTLDTTAGVMIEPSVARRRRLLRDGARVGWVPSYRRYVFRTQSRECPDLRALLLWYHDSFRIVLPGEVSRKRSRYETPLERYRQRKAVWHKPNGVGPDYLPKWSEFITRES